MVEQAVQSEQDGFGETVFRHVPGDFRINDRHAGRAFSFFHVLRADVGVRTAVVPAHLFHGKGKPGVGGVGKFVQHGKDYRRFIADGIEAKEQG